MPKIACSQRRPASHRNTGDLRIPHINGAASLLASSGQCGSLLGGSAVKSQHAIADILLQKLLERRFQGAPATACGQ